MTPDRPTAEIGPSQRIPVLQEEVRVSQETVSPAAVRVRVRPQLQPHELPLETVLHAVEIHRVAIGREVDAARPPWQDGDDWVVPVYEETVVLQRRLVLKEELRLRPRREASVSVQTVPLWRDVVQVERREADGPWTPVESMATGPDAGTDAERTNPGGPVAASLAP